MLYFSICILICFVLYLIYKPSITINHNYYNQNDKDRLDYEKELHNLQMQLAEKQRAEDLKRLEEEEAREKSIHNIINNINDFMKGE